jgi:hypothetical protein
LLFPTGTRTDSKFPASASETKTLLFCPPPPKSDSDFRLASGVFTKLEYLILNHQPRAWSGVRHSELWDVFRGVTNTADEEALERHLADEPRRDEFYDRLNMFSRTLAVALSSHEFANDSTNRRRIAGYCNDLLHVLVKKLVLVLAWLEIAARVDKENIISLLELAALLTPPIEQEHCHGD